MSEQLLIPNPDLVHDKNKAEVMAYAAKDDMDEYLDHKESAAENLANGDFQEAQDDAKMAEGHKRFAGHIATQAAKAYEDPSVGLFYEHDKEKAEFVAHAMDKQEDKGFNAMQSTQHSAEQIYDLNHKK